MIYNPHQIGYYYSGDQNNKNEIDGASSIYGQKMGVYRVLLRNMRERQNADDVDTDRRTIPKWIFKKEDRRHGLD